ncbi:hypothetical protein [Brevundimonas balnearis]|uniref:EF-hand domain-containing protein n=1 Tax=Brevundimonas balnearis TaxID=1572858 RepID=A0ABV6QYL2_9CAUL
MSGRPAKKSETLEVRLPHELKVRFMARCRDRGLTASEVVRDFIERAGAGGRRVAFGWRTLLAALAGALALGAIAAPSIAEVAAPGRGAFDRLDRDRDGVLTFEEFRAR